MGSKSNVTAVFIKGGDGNLGTVRHRGDSHVKTEAEMGDAATSPGPPGATRSRCADHSQSEKQRALATCHKLGGLRQQKCILLQFWRLEV